MEFIVTEEIEKEYHNLLKIEKKKITQKVLYFSTFLIVPIIIFFILYDHGLFFLVLFFISLTVYIILLLYILIAQIFYVSEKPFYEFLYPKIIDDINSSEPILLSYQPYPKHHDDFHESQLFPLLSTKSVNFELGFQSKHQYDVTVYDAKISNAGQRRIIYLNGYHFVIKGFVAPIFQLRTHHSPHGKTKYKKLLHITEAKAYVPLTESDIDPSYIRVFTQIKEVFESPSIQMSSIGTELHISITLKHMQRKFKKFDEYNYCKTRNIILQIVDIANLFKNENKKKEKKK